MLIGKKINLSLQEKFELLIKHRIANSYINEEGDLINIFSSSELINKELLKKGVDYKGKGINEILSEVENLRAQIVEKDFRNLNKLEVEIGNDEVWESNANVSEQLILLRECVLELAFFLHDYQYEKMNLTLKREFKNMAQFSSLLRKNEFTY